MQEKLREGELICPDCNEIFREEEGYYIEDMEQYVCRSCYNHNDYFYCDNCDRDFSDNIEHFYVEDTNETICSHCYYDYNTYSRCDNCENIFYTDNLNGCDGEYYCDDCYNTYYNNNELYNYHSFDDWRFYKSEKEDVPPFYIGAEIELEPNSYREVEGVLRAVNNHIHAIGMEDGSLNYGGVEVVTHPQSLKYYEEHKQDYINFFKEINNINYGNAGNAGLHFHVSRPNDNVISRVIVLLESFKEEIKTLSRRNGRFGYARFLSDNCGSGQKIKFQSSKFLKEKYLKGGTDRYVALNVQNSNTIEFRFFNGVNNFEEFWASLQFIKNIMELALNEKRELNTISWQELLKGEELIKQAEKYNLLHIEKYAKDTTEIVEKYEIAIEKAKVEIKRILKNMIKYINKEMSELDLKKIKDSNIHNIREKSDNFINDFRYRLQYLDKIISLYNYINNDEFGNIDIDTIKDYWRNTKNSHPVNSGRYKRYDKQIEKTFKNLESEVK